MLKRLILILALMWALPAHGQSFKVLDNCESVASWTVLSTDTSGLAVDVNHVWGHYSIEFDKVDGAANTVYGAVYRTLSSVDVEEYASNGGFFLLPLYVSATTDIDHCFLRLGTSASHYNEWRVDDDTLSAGWNNVRLAIDEPNASGNTGNGWQSSDVDYMAVGCAFDAQDDTLADVRFDRIVAIGGEQATTSSLSNDLMVVDIDAMRVDLAALEVLNTAIKTAAEKMDDWDATEDGTAATDGPQIMVEARTSQKAAMTANGDATRPVANDHGELVIAGTSWTTKKVGMEEADPLSEHRNNIELCDLSGITQGTSAVCGYFDLSGYQSVTVHCKATTTPTDTTTYTIECSSDTETTPADASYVDVTTAFLELGDNDHNASYVDEETILLLSHVPLHHCRVNYDTNSGGGDDGAITCWVKVLY